MALQALKEGSFSAAKSRCRIGSPPGSPARKLSSQVTAKPVISSRILTALDSEVLIASNENVAPALVLPYKTKKPSTTGGASSKPLVSRETLGPTLSTYFNTEKRLSLNDMPPSDSLILENEPHPHASSSFNTIQQSKQETVTPSAPPEADAAKAVEAYTKPKGPKYSYEDYKPTAKIIYARYEEEANRIAESLRGPLGFDMEWKVSYRRNVPPVERRTAVIQLCDRNTILIVQVSGMKTFPKKVKKVIEDPLIAKIGANIGNDGRKLFKDYGVSATNLVELGALARQADPTFISKRSIVSLARIIEVYCDGKVLDKGPVRVSNWEHAPLTSEQLRYAANDAHSALMAYRRMMRIAAIHELTLDASAFTSSISGVAPVAKVLSSNTSPHTHTSETPPSTSTASVTSADISGSVHPSLPVTKPLANPTNPPPPQRFPQPMYPQQIRAYRLWHHREIPLDEICAMLRSKENPLVRGTVISYVVRALQADPSLPFSMDRLKSLVRQDAGSWTRHRDWITRRELAAA